MNDGRTRPSDARLYALLTLMVFFWAGNFVVGKLALRELPPLMVAGIRTMLAGGIIWPIYFLEAGRREPHERWKGADVPMLITLGVLGVVLNQLFFVVGLSMTSVGHAAVVGALVPVMVLTIAVSARQERLTGRKIAGMVVAVAGVALLQVGREAGRGPSLLGDFFIFLSGGTFALFTVLSKHLAPRHGTVTINTFAYVGGACGLLPLTVWEGAHHPLGAVSLTAWLSIGYMALFPSVVSYLIYSHALRYLAASRVSTFSYLQPVLATLLAIVFLHEIPGGGLLAGGAMVLGGVYLTERG